MTYLYIGLYALGALAFARYYVWLVAREWPSLRWGGNDTFHCLCLSVLWPLASVIFLIAASYHHLPRGLFARWHESDVKRNQRHDR